MLQAAGRRPCAASLLAVRSRNRQTHTASFAGHLCGPRFYVIKKSRRALVKRSENNTAFVFLTGCVT